MGDPAGFSDDTRKKRSAANLPAGVFPNVGLRVWSALAFLNLKYRIRRRYAVWQAWRKLAKYRAKVCHVTLDPDGYEYAVRKTGAAASVFRWVLAVWDFFEWLASFSPIKTRLVIYPLVLTLGLGVPVFRYYTVTPGYNACVLEYVDSMDENGEYGGYLYDIEGYGRHIEPAASNLNDSLKDHRIGRSYGCLMASDNLYYDLNNTVYCSVTYLLENSPLRNREVEEAKMKTDVRKYR